MRACCVPARWRISRPSSAARIVPIYSGGLGVLAGDHIKSASDLDIPLVGIGLFYGQGYFRQRLDEKGWQQEEYLQTDVNRLPMEPAIGSNGLPVVQIDTRGGSIRAKVWRVKVGRIAICCCSIPMSKAMRRKIASLRRGSTAATGVRIRQELLLGVGGVRALRAMGNHAGRASHERRAQRIRRSRSHSHRMEEEGIGFDEAAPRVRARWCSPPIRPFPPVTTASAPT
jgi:starch phosphorylase